MVNHLNSICHQNEDKMCTKLVEHLQEVNPRAIENQNFSQLAASSFRLRWNTFFPSIVISSKMFYQSKSLGLFYRHYLISILCNYGRYIWYQLKYALRVDLSLVIVQWRCTLYPSSDSTQKNHQVKNDDLQRIITDKDRIIVATPKTIKIIRVMAATTWARCEWNSRRS